VSIVAGHPAETFPLLGTLLASYGIGLAVVLPVSVRGAYALPDTTNPFAIGSGGGMAKGLLTFAALATAIVATIPLQVANYLVPDVWLWLGLPVGAVYGGVAYYAGSRVAGDMLDRRMPELLAAVTPNR
jgi:ABC-2 type transport system permease protein